MIKEIPNQLTETVQNRLLFLHAFSGCDTVSGIYRQTKVGLLQKLCSQHNDLEGVFAEVMSLNAIQEKVVDTGLMLFWYIYGYINKSLYNHGLTWCHKMTATKIKLECLSPPSPTDGAAKEHILHSYLQYHDWILLNSLTLPQTDFWWKENSEGSFSLVFSTEAVAPEELLKMTVCNCKKNCSTTRCSCRSMSIKCIVACAQIATRKIRMK